MLATGKLAPNLKLETVAHGSFNLAKDAPAGGTLIVFYRGIFCPLCHRLLKSLDEQMDAFAERNVRVIAASGDERDAAAETIRQNNLSRLAVGYSLGMKSARDDWGLLLSDARPGSQEPAIFSEPGLFWVGQDGVLKLSVVQSLPQIRPTVPDILKAIDALNASGHPPRGGYVGDLP